jgi:hypothetical protein
MSKEKLLYLVLTKAAQMFDGATGTSHREMTDFFSHNLQRSPFELEMRMDL